MGLYLAQTAATALSVLSLCSLRATVKAYGEKVNFSSSVSIDSGRLDVSCSLNSCKKKQIIQQQSMERKDRWLIAQKGNFAFGFIMIQRVRCVIPSFSLKMEWS